ncbi:sugar ABC transporter substrate-binding protein [Desnuesiella massiliensis]|uniref:sugar ABC transporter substrate-binding protein n=1 Tax=Desnuesiella massiliensis TaxID=1650662 RepID=UPI0006E36ADC|nr:extracellular solute-binding protein [Desnuesiella massiliensis]
MNKRLKKLILPALACVFSLSLMACGKKETPSNETSTQLPKGKTLRVWSKLTPTENEVLKKDLKAWEDKTGNKVEFSLMNVSSSDLVKIVNSNERPDVIWGLSNGHTGVYAKSDIIEQMPDKLIKKDQILEKSMLDAVSYEGKVYGYPLFAETYALFVNRDKIKEVPSTWEELVKLGQANGFQYDVTNFYLSFYPIATSGGYIFKEKGEGFDVKDLGLGNEGAVKGFELIKDLTDKKIVSASTVGDIPKANFKAGKTAFYIGGPWDVDELNKAGFNYSVEKLPSINGVPGKSLLGMQTGYVIKKSTNKELAWNLVEFLSEKEKVQELMKAGNRLPAYKGYEYDNPKIKGFLDQFPNAVVKPIVPEMTLVWDPMKAALESVVTGKNTPKEAAKFGLDAVKQKIDITQ